MPPLIGYAAATGRLGSVAWALYIILFLWQFPHFMSIAWMYREDYDRAGYKMLPNREARFRLVALQTILPLLASPRSHESFANAARPSGNPLLCGSFVAQLRFFV
jgi:heme O synthase-like polyprenyltransferase